MIREKMEIDNDVQRLKLLKASYDSQRYSLQDNFMIRFPKLIKAAEEKLVCVREDLKARDAALLTSAEFAITVKITDKKGEVHMYEVADTCIIGPHDNTVKNQSDEEILTLLTCANKGTKRFVCRCVPAVKEGEADED